MSNQTETNFSSPEIKQYKMLSSIGKVYETPMLLIELASFPGALKTAGKKIHFMLH